MSELKILRTRLEQQKGQKFQLKKSVDTITTEIREKERDLRRHEEAREVIREVGLKTQQQLAFHISDITSLALEAVFDNPYQLNVEFVQRRNKTECDLLFVRNDHIIDPIGGAGVGAIDVTTFALRIASWSMFRPHTRNVIILDEPFKHLSVDLQDRASTMIKELSSRLNLQFIIITHEEALTTAADKVFQVSIRKGISKVE